MKDIKVDDEVVEFVKSNKRDYRVSTSCYGPVIVPTLVKPPKDSDLKIKIGDQTLFVSQVQARQVSRITKDMIYDSRYDSCPLF
jgi:hypothetical protein